MRRVTEDRKIREKRGQGEGADYKPWIKGRETRGVGSRNRLRDWKNGRTVELLSDGEEMAYYQLRWDDHVTDIREQYPLDFDKTVAVAKKIDPEYGEEIQNLHERLTTDLYVTYEDDTGNRFFKAYSVKADYDTVFGTPKTEKERREIEKIQRRQYVEMKYWKLQGVPFKIIFKDQMNRVLIDNIRTVVEFYDKDSVRTKHDAVKYLIAHKYIAVDMEHELIIPKIIELADQIQGEDWADRLPG